MSKTHPKSDSPTIAIHKILDRVGLSAETLIQNAEENPTLFRIAVDFRLECLKKRNETKLEWERAKATCDLAIREEARITGQKVTEAQVASKTILDEKVWEAQKLFNSADEMDVWSTLILKIFEMRRDSLKIMESVARDNQNTARLTEAAARELEAARESVKRRFPGK